MINVGVFERHRRRLSLAFWPSRSFQPEINGNVAQSLKAPGGWASVPFESRNAPTHRRSYPG